MTKPMTPERVKEIDMSLGFTGTREGWTDKQADAVIDFLDSRLKSAPFEFHHGDCVGSDAAAHDVVRQFGSTRIVSHPPEKRQLRAFRKADEYRPKKPYLVRNRDIVDETAELLATPDGPERRQSGTWSTVRYAKKCGKRVTIVMPNGSVRVISPSRTHVDEGKTRKGGVNKATSQVSERPPSPAGIPKRPA